jgi:co-chaperonin GroES (HSP10)
MSRGDEKAIVNTSGFEPLDLRVIVLPDEVEEKTVGGIILPEQHKDREKYAMMHGTLIAAGENAWEEAVARSPNFTKPVAGDRVVIAKYGGVLLTGKDGKDYRIMNDEDVVARVTGG